MARLGPSLTAEQKSEVIAEGYRNPVFLCRTFLADWFPNYMPWFHRGILAILTKRTDFLLDFSEETWPQETKSWDEAQLDKLLRHFVWKSRPDDDQSPENPVFERNGDKIDLRCTDFTLIMLPRGFSKTTLINSSNIWHIVYQMAEFIVYISKSGNHAEEQLNAVKQQLMINPLLQTFFGNLVPDRNDSKRWRSDLIETLNGVILVARGIEGQVRGLVHDGKRPDKYVIDDVEDEESVATDAQRQKTRSRFYKSIRPGRRRIGRRGEFIVLATMLHPDDLPNNMARDPQFTTVIFGAVDRDGDALWPLMMGFEALEKEKKSYATNGQLNAFYLEYYNQIRNDETSVFRGPFVHEHMDRAKFVGVAVALDPAISESKKSDQCAFAVVGQTENGQKHVIDIRGSTGMHPREQLNMFFELHFKWNCTHHGVEATAYQASLIYLLKEEMFRQAKQFGQRAYFDITPIRYHKEKKARIKGILAPLYNSGYITHQRRFPDLETQLLDFPNGKDDYPDVVAMACELLDPFVALAGDEDSVLGNAYKPLDIVLGEWRTAP